MLRRIGADAGSRDALRVTLRAGPDASGLLAATPSEAQLALRKLHCHRRRWAVQLCRVYYAGRMEQLDDGPGSTQRQADCLTTRPSGEGRRKQSYAQDSELNLKQRHRLGFFRVSEQRTLVSNLPLQVWVVTQTGWRAYHHLLVLTC